MSDDLHNPQDDKPNNEQWHDRVCEFLGVPDHLKHTMEFPANYDPWKDLGVPYNVKQLRIHTQ